MNSLRAPAVVGADAPADRFSAERAMDHLATIAAEPHPLGTEAHTRVREYIVGEIEALGLRADVQEATVAFERPSGWISAATVVNVMTRLPGTGDGSAVLVLAHYDSVPGSPGAGDDGSSVAAMLEALRLFSDEAPFENDLIFLFTDGEEAGLFGARAFVEQHPWLEDVGVVLNFESRGTRGPSLMFETSGSNGRLISDFRQAGVRSFAASYSYELYRVMPNDTDFSIFRRAGVEGLNFAFIHGATGYHTGQDNLERLDPRSVQGHGDAMVRLVRHFGAAYLGVNSMVWDSVYFNLPGGLFVSYPAAVALPLVSLLGIALGWLMVRGLKQRRLSVGRLLLGLLAHLVLATVIAGLLYLIAPRLLSRYDFALWNDWSSRSLGMLALGLVASAVVIWMMAWGRRRLGCENLAVGGLVLWWILAVVLSKIAPGGSYLFTVPLIFWLAGASGWRDALSDRRATLRSFALPSLAGVITVLIWMPTFSMVVVALGPGAALPVGLLLALVLGLLDPLIEQIGELSRRFVPVVVLGVGLLLLIAVRLASVHDGSNRSFDSVIYALDVEAGEANWITLDRAPDEWTTRFLGESPRSGTTPDFIGYSQSALLNDAPLASIGKPEVELAEETAIDGGTARAFRIRFPFRAHRALVFLESESIRSIEINGRRVEPIDGAGFGDEARLSVFAPPAGGLSLRVETGGGSPLDVDVAAHRYGLPSLPGFDGQPRPSELMQRPGWSIDSTFIRGTALLGAE